jgi:hypothetical protein
METPAKRPQIKLLTLMACGVVASMFGPAVYYIVRDIQSGPKVEQVNLMFVLGCIGVLLIIAWKVKSIRGKLTVWFAASMVLGLFGSYVPRGIGYWGMPWASGFYYNGRYHDEGPFLNMWFLFIAGVFPMLILHIFSLYVELLNEPPQN